MMVDAGKAQILKWKVAKFFNRLVDTNFAVLNLL
jgi:hypothetical protein